MMSFSETDQVRWRWGHGYSNGVIRAVYPAKTTYRHDGYETTRHGNPSDPVLRIECARGYEVIRLSSEVEPLH